MARLDLVIIVATATVCLLQPAIGDEALINTVCGWTPEKDACLTCLTVAAGSYQKNAKELAAISMNCTTTLSYTVIEDFARIGAARSSDDFVRQLCLDGMNKVETAKVTVLEAIEEWNNGRFHSAGDKVANADDLYTSCTGIVKKLIPPPHPMIEDDLSLLKKYYLNTKAILYKL